MKRVISNLVSFLKKHGLPEEADSAKQLIEDDSKSIEQKAIQEYGITYDPRLAGYILANGDFLDFSGGSGDRAYDHREVAKFLTGNFETRTDAMDHFMRLTKAIRLGVVNDYILLDLKTDPTDAQLRSIQYALRVVRPDEVTIDTPTHHQVSIERPNMGKILKVIAPSK